MTAGPWRLVRQGTAEDGWWDVMSGVPARGRQVAIVVGVLGHDRESEANAALIASAPDLLAERDRLRAERNEVLAALKARPGASLSGAEYAQYHAWLDNIVNPLLARAALREEGS